MNFVKLEFASQLFSANIKLQGVFRYLVGEAISSMGETLLRPKLKCHVVGMGRKTGVG